MPGVFTFQKAKRLNNSLGIQILDTTNLSCFEKMCKILMSSLKLLTVAERKRHESSDNTFPLFCCFLFSMLNNQKPLSHCFHAFFWVCIVKLFKQLVFDSFNFILNFLYTQSIFTINKKYMWDIVNASISIVFSKLIILTIIRSFYFVITQLNSIFY